MKYLGSLCLLLLALYSCSDQNKTSADKNTDKETISANPIVTAVNLLGSYVGSFGDNKITLLITKATGDSVSGRSIVGGNDRPFVGTMSVSGDNYTIDAKEPGDNQYDGVFHFTISAAKPNEVAGTWAPNKPTATLKEKSYSLERREFRYVQNAGFYPQASERLLTDADVDNMGKSDLEFMRNEIFARHGYCFQKKNLRQMFENEEWYIPNTVDVKKDLTETEKKNIALIKKYEKYAEEYGDDFGR